MFGLLKLIIWICGLAVVACFALDYFGYEINLNYFNESKAKCEERMQECGKKLIHEGTDNAQCDFNCMDPKVIIKKK